MKKPDTKTKLFASICATLMIGAMAVSAREISDYDMIMPRFGGRTVTDSLYKVGS